MKGRTPVENPHGVVVGLDWELFLRVLLHLGDQGVGRAWIGDGRERDRGGLVEEWFSLEDGVLVQGEGSETMEGYEVVAGGGGGRHRELTIVLSVSVKTMFYS